jgi:hypothetical protein
MQRAAGILVRRVSTEPEAEPPRACIAFTVAPQRRDDFHAEDWVRLEPPVQGAAVTREGDRICISGLPSGAATRVVLRAGMPGEGGLKLAKDTGFSVAIANRRPRVDFDTRMFVLPRGQMPALDMTTVNLSAVKLTLARLSERNVVAFVRGSRLGQPVDAWDADRISEQNGRVIWQGGAEVPKWESNRTTRRSWRPPWPPRLAVLQWFTRRWTCRCRRRSNASAGSASTACRLAHRSRCWWRMCARGRSVRFIPACGAMNPVRVRST